MNEEPAVARSALDLALRASVLSIDASRSGETVGRAGVDAESGAGGDHRRLPGVDGGDDLGVVDPLQIDGGDAEVGMAPSWRWMTLSGAPSCASSTAWAWRSWCGANRRRTPALAGRGGVGRGRRHSPKAARRLARRSRTAAGRPASRCAIRARGGGGPSPMGPCRPRGGGRPCRGGRAPNRRATRGRGR
jgi:hypothetical protein